MIATDLAIRPLRCEGAASASDLLREVDPHWIAAAALVEHWLDHTPARAQWQAWIAESGGRMVAWADAQLDWDKERADVGQLWIGVLPEARRRGIGSRLYDLGEEHLRHVGARTMRAGVESADGVAFANARGFTEVRQERVSKLETDRADLSELDELEARARAAGFELVPLRRVIDREHRRVRRVVAGQQRVDAVVPTPAKRGELREPREASAAVAP